MARNPYAISFGRIPNKYISRSIIIDDIIDILESNPVEEQAFKITGIRGTGKTVTLTAIEKEIKERPEWIVVGLRSNGNLLIDLIANLYSSVPFVTEFINTTLNLSKFGIGLDISKKSPVESLDYALKAILKTIEKKNKKVLVTIDEARATSEMIDFIQEFQLLIREELPVYLIAAGLYDDIESIENADGLTFFLRATKIEMTPLNYTIMRADYEETIGVSRETAEKMAAITKGYPFAYQALGKYVWENPTHELCDYVLAELDEALAAKVYDKIWSELTDTDRWYMTFIAEKDSLTASELLEITNKSHSEWSIPRKRLSAKGLINTKERGKIRLCLPRFKEYIENNR